MEEGLAASAEAAAATPEELAAAARLGAGDLERARLLLCERGGQLRSEAEACLAAALDGELAGAPWRAFLDRAEAAGEEAEASTREALEEEAAAGLKRSARDVSDEAKRAARRRRTEILDLGLQLCAAWLRDLGAVADGAEEVAFNRDRLAALREQAGRVEPAPARDGAVLVEGTRRSLDLNASEELALESLFFRLERLLA